MRAQGALEYLIIIAAVLGISAIVVLFVTGAFTASSSGADISKCRLAAANCQRDLALGLGISCAQCDDACKVASTGKEVLFGTTAVCKTGKTSSIAKGLTVAVVQDASCPCVYTMSGCSTWWKDRLVERDFNVEFIGISVLQDVNAMKTYRAILNPYGEYYLDYGGSQYTVLDNIREYVRQGGYWFEYGGWSFFYSCSANNDPYGAGGKQVCIGIAGGGIAPAIRNVTAYGKRVSPDGPISTIETSVNYCPRPSIGNDFTGYPAGCSVLASGASYNPLYLNTTFNYAGPAAHCYGSGCIVRSDRIVNDMDIATIYAEYLRTTVF
jgi:hypothetical protein